MKVEGRKLIFDCDEDYEFVKLVNTIKRINYGEMRIKIKKGIPCYVIEVGPGFPLSREVKDEKNYGD